MNRAQLVTAFKRWMGTQVPRLERATLTTITITDRPDGFSIVATWPATLAGPAGRWSQDYGADDIQLAMKFVRCKARRGIAQAILQARGV